MPKSLVDELEAQLAAQPARPSVLSWVESHMTADEMDAIGELKRRGYAASRIAGLFTEQYPDISGGKLDGYFRKFNIRPVSRNA